MPLRPVQGEDFYLPPTSLISVTDSMGMDEKSIHPFDPTEVVLSHLPPLPDLFAPEPSPTIKAKDTSERDRLSEVGCPCKQCLCVDCKCGVHKEEDSIESAPTGSETGEALDSPESDNISVADIKPIEPSIPEAQLLSGSVKRGDLDWNNF